MLLKPLTALFHVPCLKEVRLHKKLKRLRFASSTILRSFLVKLIEFVTPYQDRPRVTLSFFDKLVPYTPSDPSATNIAREEALQFVQTLLEEKVETQPLPFVGGRGRLKDPVDERITRLNALFCREFRPRFETALQENEIDPWSQEAVIEAADACMKITYAIGIFMLEDLPRFIERENKGTRESVLIDQSSYQYRAFFICPNFYHHVRAAVSFGVNPAKKLAYPKNTHKKEIYHPLDPRGIPPSHVRPFYQEGTRQHKWNLLYNNYCTLAGQEELLEKRFSRWTQEDTGIKTFSPRPDTQPS